MSDADKTVLMRALNIPEDERADWSAECLVNRMLWQMARMPLTCAESWPPMFETWGI